MRMAGAAGSFAQYRVKICFRCAASLRIFFLILHKITSLPDSPDYGDRLLVLLSHKTQNTVCTWIIVRKLW